jgi:hypothetical protein
MTAYQPGIPTGQVPLNVDYQNIQNNFDQLDTTYGVDHVKYSVALNNGYHKNIHLVPNALSVATPGFGQLFNDTVNDGFDTDQILYFLTGTGNKLLQLTSNVVPKKATNGYTFLPGGFLLQWGIFPVKIPPASSTGAIVFATSNIDFPNNCFNVSCTLIAKVGGTGSANTIAPIDGTVTKTGFNYSYTGTDSYVKMYWLAIGN